MENRDQFSALKFILRVKVNSKVEELSKKKKKQKTGPQKTGQCINNRLSSVKPIVISWLCYFIVAHGMAFNLSEHHFLNYTNVD